MITSVFKKSTPFNYILIAVLIQVFFFIYQFQNSLPLNSLPLIFQKCASFFVLLATFFIINFIVKKNGLSKDSTYTVLFYLLFLLFIPSVLNDFKLLFSNFFILLAFRRLVSLQSLKSAKEKIFDASLWVFVATLFHFWSILFIILVFVSIFFHVSRDYRNWVLPFIALFGVGVISMLFFTVFNVNILDFLISKTNTNFEITYFTSNYQHIAFSVYATIALFFVVYFITTMSKRPLLLKTSFTKILAFLFIAVLVFVISGNKSNSLLIYTIAPLAILATNTIEFIKEKLKQEIILGALILCSLFVFFFQL